MQTIIRNETDWDRNDSKVRVSRQQVLDAIARYPNDRFTSCDIAEFMGIPEHEYSVRTAIHWLRRQRVIKLADETHRKVYRSNTVSMLNVYFCASQTGVDFDLLNKAFLRFGV